MTEGATAGRSAKWWRALFRPWSPRMAMAAVLAVASCGVVLAFVAEAGLERGRNLSGQVTDANDGTPVVAATVEVDGEFGPNGAIIGGVAHTDDQGRFELRVRSGDRWIRVRSDGYATKTIRVPERNREAIVVALDTGGTIAGRLVLPTGEPATGVVTLVASRTDPLRPLGFWEVHQLLRGGRKAAVRESGEFRLENVPPGRYKLIARSRSGMVRDRLVEVYERSQPVDSVGRQTSRNGHWIALWTDKRRACNASGRNVVGRPDHCDASRCRQRSVRNLRHTERRVRPGRAEFKSPRP